MGVKTSFAHAKYKINEAARGMPRPTRIGRILHD